MGVVSNLATLTHYGVSEAGSAGRAGACRNAGTGGICGSVRRCGGTADSRVFTSFLIDCGGGMNSFSLSTGMKKYALGRSFASFKFGC